MTNNHFNNNPIDANCSTIGQFFYPVNLSVLGFSMEQPPG